jgi:hypothetical protein
LLSRILLRGVHPTSAAKSLVTAFAVSCVALLIVSLGAAAAQAPPSVSTQRELKNHPPYPNTTKPAEIRANLLWSLEQSHWDPALEQALRQGSIVFARTLDVESGLGRDYYLLEIDTTTGAPFRTVKLGKDGWIQADAPWNGHPRRVTALDLQVVAQQLREKHGAVNAHYFHTYGTVESGGGSDFLPLVKAQTPDGTVLLVNSKGEVFRQLAITPRPFSYCTARLNCAGAYSRSAARRYHAAACPRSCRTPGHRRTTRPS